jgi:hypothetical protein
MTTPAFNELADALNFTEADLSANRAGSMTARQLKHLWIKRLGMALAWVGVFFVASGFAVFSIYFLLLSLNSLFRSLGDFLLSLPSIITALAAGALAVGCFYLLFTDRKQRWFAYGDDLKARSVNCTTGQLTKGEVVGRKINYWTISVGNERFKINQKIFSCFEQYGFYHVYFTPHTRIILSAEFSQDTI